MKTLLLASALAIAAFESAQHAPPRLAMGANVPDFTVSTLDGRTQKLSDLQKDAQGKARPVVLTFWCSFCDSCRQVDSRLADFAKKFDGRVAFYAIDASANEPAAKVSAFLKRKNLSIPMLLDPKATSADVFGVKVTTTTVVIDANGVLRYRGRFGRASESPAEDALTSVLAGAEVKVKEPGFFG